MEKEINYAFSPIYNRHTLERVGRKQIDISIIASIS